MCLGIPALVLERIGDIGKVDFGGTQRDTNLSLVDAKAGDYVIIHAGFAIQVLEEKHALETLALFRAVYGDDITLSAVSGPEPEAGAPQGGRGKPHPAKKGKRHA